MTRISAMVVIVQLKLEYEERKNKEFLGFRAINYSGSICNLNVLDCPYHQFCFFLEKYCRPSYPSNKPSLISHES